MSWFLVAAGVWLLGFVGLLGLIILTALSLWRDRHGETLWINAKAESDPVRAYKVAKDVRRHHSGARG